MLKPTRPLHVMCMLAAIVVLSACAGPKHQARAEAKDEIIVKGKDAKGYRFDMTQRGKKMSADDFEAWMKANGLRIAKGPDSKTAKAKAKASAKSKRD
jgi:outer membrane lipoprotein-sorting protein